MEQLKVSTPEAEALRDDVLGLEGVASATEGMR